METPLTLTEEEMLNFWEMVFQEAMDEASGMSWKEMEEMERNRCDYFLPSQLNDIIRWERNRSKCVKGTLAFY